MSFIDKSQPREPDLEGLELPLVPEKPQRGSLVPGIDLDIAVARRAINEIIEHFDQLPLANAGTDWSALEEITDQLAFITVRGDLRAIFSNIAKAVEAARPKATSRKE